MATTRLNERTLKMMENFIVDHKADMSIAEIAEKYGITKWTVYEHLDEIAEKNHVSRDSLLDVIKTHYTFNQTKKREIVTIDIEKFDESTQKIVDNIDDIIKMTEEVIEEE